MNTSAEFIPLFPLRSPRTEKPESFSPAPMVPPPVSTGVLQNVQDAQKIQTCIDSPSDLKVELVRNGPRISQIRLHCRCGEVIEIDCEY